VSTVHVVVPDSVADPARPSGGNTYDRRVCAGLRDLGWDVRLHLLPGDWPHPDAGYLDGLAGTLASLPQGSVVLVDGLVASAHPEVLLPAAGRLRIVVLVHLPLGHPLAAEAAGGPAGALPSGTADGERAVLTAAAAVLTTSRWTADWLRASYDLAPDGIRVARPGADRARPATGSADGSALLTVAAVVPAKGHAELLDALTSLRDRSWRLVCTGPLDRAPGHVARLRARCRDAGITDRVTFTGTLGGEALDRAYAASDLVVVPSRIETYGLVVTEALARALPVVAAAVGGLEEAMGAAPGADQPGRLVRPGAALAGALRSWLDDATVRERWRGAARERSTTLEPWSVTARRVSDLLAGVAQVNRSRTAYVGVGAGPDPDGGRPDPAPRPERRTP
jgi:glycosyltransferase involved in cell wall biosynthesis